MRWGVEIRIKKSVFKNVEKLPNYVQILYDKSLEKMAFKFRGWELKKMAGKLNLYRAKLNQNYRVIMEYVKPDIIIIKVASREGVYK